MDERIAIAGRDFTKWLSNATPADFEEIQPISALLRTRAVRFSSEPANVLLEFDIDHRLSNYMGNIHGGAIAAMMDECAGMAACIRVGRGFRGTLKMAIEYLRPVSPGRLRCEGHITTETERDLVVEVVLRNLEENMLARATSVVRFGQPR